MNHAVLIGAYGFLGYGLCKVLLEKGIEVEAITVGFEEGECFTEEKQMEIGRNANFTVSSLTDRPAIREDLTPIIIPFYDFFLKGVEASIFNDKSPNILTSRLPAATFSVTVLLPVQLAYSETTAFDDHYLPFRKYLKDSGISLQEIYLPCLFGPWQTKDYLFQQIMYPDKRKGSLPVLNPREPTADAIYIEDAAIAILNLLDKRKGKHLIRSGNSNMWKECIKWLCDSRRVQSGGALKVERNGEIIDLEKFAEAGGELEKKWPEEINEVCIENPTPFEKGLKNQRQYYERWLKTI